ncbi:MAG: hypothetical protein ACKOTZ_07900 [Chloroflexota bacterium]
MGWDPGADLWAAPAPGAADPAARALPVHDAFEPVDPADAAGAPAEVLPAADDDDRTPRASGKRRSRWRI